MAKTHKKGLEIEERISNLRKTVERHRHLYHTEDNPEISDEAYDSLVKELEELEQENPEFQDTKSPTVQVGGEPLKQFSKVAHEVRQWSFNDVFNTEELEKWEERIRNFMRKGGIESEELEYCVELKIDGLKIILTYENGKLIRGATRGNGQIGVGQAPER